MTVKELIQRKMNIFGTWIEEILIQERVHLQRNDFAAASRASEARLVLTIKRLTLEDLLQEIENSAPAEPAGVLSLRAGDTELIAEASDARWK